MVLADGRELPVLIPFDQDIPLEELNKIYAKSREFIESLKDAGGNNKDNKKLGP